MRNVNADPRGLTNYTTDNYMDKNRPDIKKAKKEILKQHYGPIKRSFEIFFVCSVLVTIPMVLYNILSHVGWSSLPAAFFGAILGALFADLMSGLVHWGADTWGTLDWPLVGGTFIRSFREHHVAPTEMCEHDFFETNGDNFMLSIIPLVVLSRKDIFWTASTTTEVPLIEIFSAMFWLTGSFYIAMTNQFHQWAHAPKPNALVTLLQNCWIILPRYHHSLHHRPAFEGHYCITIGWLNPLFDAIHFWRTLEFIVIKATGLVPREDDWKWTGLAKETPKVVLQYMEQKKNKEKKN